jgi:23S rRNA (cytosine1962-C5)-methyltransferase
MPFTPTSGTRPVRVDDRGAARLTASHPWVYRSDVLDLPDRPGFAPVVDRRGQALGWAAVHPTSQIAVRLVHRGSEAVDEALLLRLLHAALDHRDALARDPATELAEATGYRLVHAEADALPGLIVDRLGEALVIQNGCAAMEAHLRALVAALVERLAPRMVIGRFDGAVRDLEGLARGTPLLYGEEREVVTVSDGRLRWRIDPRAGQKTGSYLDQRLNHARFARIAAAQQRTRRVLDVFAHHGGFGLHLLAAGAEEATLIDASAAALATAVEAARAAGLAEPTLHLGDAFQALRGLVRAGERFDAIALDPPALAKRARDVPRASAGYKELNLRALMLLAPGGVLATCSCSAHLSESAFLDVLADAAVDARCRVRILERRGAAPDHPERLGFPESSYLKCIVLQRIG